MTKVEVSAVIECPAEEVFTFVANFENNHLWQSGVTEATFTAGDATQVGAKCTQISKFLGKRIEFHFEVVEFESGRLIKHKTESGSFPVAVTRIVEPVHYGAKVTAIINGDASGFMKLAQPILDRMTRKSIEGDYIALKTFLERRTKG